MPTSASPDSQKPAVRSKVLFDCDPGVDDAVALLLAFASQDLIELLGITTVAGNVDIVQTTRNACVVRELAQRIEVPIAAGAQRPLQREPIAASHFHGATGLGDLTFTSPRHGPVTESAQDFLKSILYRAAPRSISWVITGPMTNVASLISSEPTLLAAIKEFVVMGGARSEGGNITASAEYNIFADPHAAREIFAVGLPVQVFGLDVTHQLRATPARIQRLRATGSLPASTAAQLLDFASGLPAYESGQGSPVHDPCPIAWLLAPELFEFRDCHVEVECDSPLTVGHTAVEFRVQPGKSRHVRWAVGVDAEGFFALLEHRLGGVANP